MAEPRYQLSSATRELLRKGVSNAFKDAPDASRLAIASALTSLFHSHVSAELMKRNDLHSLQRHLPGELWCGIWQWMPFIDRLRILDVCRAWRFLARATPSIWSQIHCYSTVHNRCPCECEACLEDDKSTVPGWIDSPYRKNGTNVELVRDALSMGKDVPVHLSVDIIPTVPASYVLRALSTACAAHAARIVSINWRTCDSDSVGEFLLSLPTLPSLRRMTVDWLPDVDTRDELYGCTVHNISEMIVADTVPNLESLSFHQFYFYQPARNPRPLCSLSSLSLSAISPEVLTSLLTHCPRLTSLDVHLGNADRSLTAESPAVQDLRAAIRAASLMSIKVREWQYVEHWALPVFLETRAADLSLQYYMYSDTAPGHPIHRIFGELSGNIGVACVGTADEYAVRATDEVQTARALVLCGGIAALLSRIVDAVSPHRVTSLAMDLVFWREVAPVHLGSGVTTITLIIPTRSALADQIAEVTDAAPFPALEVVRITPDTAQDLLFTIEDIISLIPRLGLPLPVPHIAIDPRIVRQCQRLPRELALRTSVEWVAPVSELSESATGRIYPVLEM